MSDVRTSMPFSIEMGRIIEVLAAQIYPSPFALVRENVQNAFDAIMLRRHAGEEFEPFIDVLIEPHRVRVADNGIGMRRCDLQDHFWRAGSSSKNTEEARAAGVVGTFGIGAMANFGIAEKLEVVSESATTGERTRCLAERATLSVTDDCIAFERLETTGAPGSTITATMQNGRTIDVAQATQYVREFVQFVELPVTVNGVLVSQDPLEEAVPRFKESWQWSGADTPLGTDLVADVELCGSATGDVRVDLSAIRYRGMPIAGRIILRQGVGAIRTFRNRFGLAATSMPSYYALGGAADFLLLQPTAGREALTAASISFINSFAAPVDALISHHLSKRPEANNSQSFVNWAAAHRRWDLCGNLRAVVQPGDSATLEELARESKTRSLLVYGGTDAATMRLASPDRPIVLLARNDQRRKCEVGFLGKDGQLEMLSDKPKILDRLDRAELTIAQSAMLFRVTEILNSDYFLTADVGFGRVSHDLPILLASEKPVSIVLNPNATNVTVILQIYEKEYGAFSHMAKDFVRNVVFPKVSHLVPSATRQGTEAFLKTLQRTRDVFEYERKDLESLTSLWTDYMEGKITKEQAAVKAAAFQRSYQVINALTTGRVRDVVPDVEDVPVFAIDRPPQGAEVDVAEVGGPMPPIQRTDIATDRKLLVIDSPDPPLKGYRCFMAISRRIQEERGDFFLQPHRTSVVWGGQKALFIFEHHSGEVGLYYDVQMKEPVAVASGGGSFETCTIVMKNQTFIPIPSAIQPAFMPTNDETKRLEVRCDLLYMDPNRD